MKINMQRVPRVVTKEAIARMVGRVTAEGAFSAECFDVVGEVIFVVCCE
jgi:hypothetical protein